MSLDPKTSKQGKLRVCSKALHPEFSYPLIDVAEMSIQKGYKPLNWLDKNNKVTVLYLIEAAQRHLDKLKLGIDINDEERDLNGLPTIQVRHAAQVAYNMLMLCLQQDKGVYIDDRLYKDGILKRSLFSELKEGIEELETKFKNNLSKEKHEHINKALDLTGHWTEYKTGKDGKLNITEFPDSP